MKADGPRSVAMYLGTHAIIGSSATVPMARAFADALMSGIPVSVVKHRRSPVGAE